MAKRVTRQTSAATKKAAPAPAPAPAPAAPAKKSKASAKTKKAESKKDKEAEQDELNKDTLKLADSSDEEEEEENVNDSDSDNENSGEGEDFGGFSSTDEEEDEEDENTKKSVSKKVAKDSKKRQQKDVEEEEEEQKPIAKKAKTQHKVTAISANANKNKKNAGKKQPHKRGILYIGRLPEGFDEPELKKYFSQFGNIINLRVARNKKTGKSKHYAFLEFDNYEVAKIAQETMNNYLIFNHILKCQLLEEDQDQSSTGDAEANEKLLNLFKNSNKKFKKVPWAKISKNKFDKYRSTEKWNQLKQKNDDKKKQRLEKLKDAGFNFDLTN